MQYLTLGEAEDEVGVAKSTISRAIKAGRLSASRNEHGHYQIDPAELFRVYPPKAAKASNDDERNTTQQPVQQDATPQNAPVQNETVRWMIKRLEETESKLASVEQELDEKEQAYNELREAYSVLPSPEAFETKLAAEVERLEQEKVDALQEKQELHDSVIDAERVRQAQRMRESKEQAEQWKAELVKRKQQIEEARVASEELREKTEQERRARELLSQQLSALESRGWIDRLLNRKPNLDTAGN